MFTGIVEELGTVAGLEQFANSARLTVSGPLVATTAALGSSIAVNGVCLTVTGTADGQFTAHLMGETLARTSLGSLTVGRMVNLERPVLVDGRLHGHIVQGHVDGIGLIIDVSRADQGQVLRVAVPNSLFRYIVKKGSITIDGVSLTVSEIGAESPGPMAAPDHESWFEVSLIPETCASTTLGSAAVGAVANVEVDVLAKYVERTLVGGVR